MAGRAAAALIALLLGACLSVPSGLAALADAAPDWRPVGLPDGPAWLHGRVALAAAPCLTLTVTGTVASIDRGQAALVEVEGVGRVVLFFPQNAPPSARAAATVLGLRVDSRVGFDDDGRSRHFESKTEFCRSGGKTFDGEFSLWAYHTGGVVADRSRLDVAEGSLGLRVLSSGTSVTLYNNRDFTGGQAVEVAAPRLDCCLAPGESVTLGARVTVQSATPVFGTFAVYEAADNWVLTGPAGAIAYRTDLGVGGNIDPLSFRGEAGTWSARVDRSVSLGTPGMIFLVVANT